VEVAAGVSFDSYLTDSLIAPAGLRHTGLWGREPPGLTLAPPADPRRVARQKPTIYRDGHSVANWGFRGCAGVYSTAEDLHAWVRALQRGQVLGPGELPKLIGRHVLVRRSESGESWTGYGWGVKVKDGRDLSYGHAGSDDWLGQSSVIHWTPDGEVVVVLANSGEIGGEGWASRANRAVRRALDAP
jgi:CubicO group peptidase (beta-lactamase class C family)